MAVEPSGRPTQRLPDREDAIPLEAGPGLWGAGTSLASMADGTVYVGAGSWILGFRLDERGFPVRTGAGHPLGAAVLHLAAQGQQLAAVLGDSSVILFDHEPASGELRERVRWDFPYPELVAIGGDEETLLAVASRDQLKIRTVDSDTWTWRRSRGPHCTPLDLRASTRILAVACDGSVEIYDMRAPEWPELLHIESVVKPRRIVLQEDRLLIAGADKTRHEITRWMTSSIAPLYPTSRTIDRGLFTVVDGLAADPPRPRRWPVVDLDEGSWSLPKALLAEDDRALILHGGELHSYELTSGQEIRARGPVRMGTFAPGELETGTLFAPLVLSWSPASLALVDDRLLYLNERHGLRVIERALEDPLEGPTVLAPLPCHADPLDAVGTIVGMDAQNIVVHVDGCEQIHLLHLDAAQGSGGRRIRSHPAPSGEALRLLLDRGRLAMISDEEGELAVQLATIRDDELSWGARHLLGASRDAAGAIVPSWQEDAFLVSIDSEQHSFPFPASASGPPNPSSVGSVTSETYPPFLAPWSPAPESGSVVGLAPGASMEVQSPPSFDSPTRLAVLTRAPSSSSGTLAQRPSFSLELFEERRSESGPTVLPWKQTEVASLDRVLPDERGRSAIVRRGLDWYLADLAGGGQELLDWRPKGFEMDVVRDEDRLYVLSDPDGTRQRPSELQIYELDRSGRPRLVGSSCCFEAQRLSLDDERLLLIDEAHASVLDLSDPTSPRSLRPQTALAWPGYDRSFGSTLQLVGERILRSRAWDHSRELVVADLLQSDPASAIRSLGESGAFVALDGIGAQLRHADSTRSLRLLDLRDPDRIHEIVELVDPDGQGWLAAWDDRFFIVSSLAITSIRIEDHEVAEAETYLLPDFVQLSPTKGLPPLLRASSLEEGGPAYSVPYGGIREGREVTWLKRAR